MSILIVFSLISSVNASELSDNQMNNDALGIMMNDNIQITDDAYLQNMEKSILADSNSIYISTDGSDESGDGSQKKPYQSLNHGVEKSDNDSTIYLSEGIFSGAKNQNITVDKSLTIIGTKDKTTIDGENCSNIFIMNSNAKLTLIGLCLTNAYRDGNQTDNGGAIINEGGQLTLINCTIKNSYGNYNGGAVYNNLGRLTIINSSFINNSAIQYGGCLYTLGYTTIENSYFSENSILAEKGVGGAIAAGGTITIKDTEFNTNHAIYSAATLLSLGNATIDNCKFIYQKTNYTGGAISNHGDMFINNSYFYACESRFYAAAILAPPSGHHVTTVVYNTVFEKNHAGNHAAVTNNFKDTELTMINCALINNYIVKNEYFGDISLDDNATVQYCWWGQNTISPYYYSPHSSEREPEKINASRWLVMTFTSDNGMIEQDKTNILTVSLHQYFDNDTKEIYDYSEDINLPLTVNFYTNSGKLIKSCTLENGTASIDYTPDEKVRYVYAQLNNQTIVIDVKQKDESQLTVNNLTKYYSESRDLEINLTDGNNNPLINKTVSISTNGKVYNKTTDENGIAKLNIDFSAGTYDAVVSFSDEVYKNQNKTVEIIVLKNKTSIQAQNLVKYYKNGTKLSVKLLDNNKKALKSKTVKIKIGSNVYSATTNSKGIAQFAINNKVGTYSVKVYFNGDKAYEASSKTIKVYVKSAKVSFSRKKIKRNSYLVATYKTKDNKLIKNTKVKFTLNGKTYTVTTNSKGQAKLKISLKKGTYTVKTSFKSTVVYGASVFSTKIKVV